MLNRKQARFIEEFIVDLNGKQAAIRAGYSPKTAEVQASRLLSYTKVLVALEDAIQARSKRTEVTADRVITEYARIAFSNIRDYWPKKGETIDLQRLDQDRTAAVEEIIKDEFVDQAGTVHRRTRVKLHDKKAALDSLARHLGMFVDPRVAEESFAYRVQMMTSEERLALVAELLEEGRKLLLPLLKEEDEDELAQQEEQREQE